MSINFLDVISLIRDVISNLTIRNSCECKVLDLGVPAKVTCRTIASIVYGADSDYLLVGTSIDSCCGDSKTDQTAWYLEIITIKRIIVKTVCSLEDEFLIVYCGA